MAITVKVHTNSDDAMVAWRPRPWPTAWVGFRLERRNELTGAVATINNRIPPQPGQGEVPPGGIPSDLSPIRRCLWTDHTVDEADQVAYRVTPMVADGASGFVLLPEQASAWTASVTVSGAFGNGVQLAFNRGTVMSQVVSRMAGAVTVAALRQLKAKLADPGYPGRRYLAGDARHLVLTFLAEADRRGDAVFAALYELNDRELIDALKAFGPRAHLLLGNGSGTPDGLADELRAAGLDLRRRDLSKKGASSPSVHNKFVVACRADGQLASRVLTGSTNWTTTGLCTQLNNVLVLTRPRTATRFLQQWRALAEAGDAMPAALKAANAVTRVDGPVRSVFAATRNQADLAGALGLIAGAKDGLFFLMFMPGQSPLLAALMGRAAAADAPHVRGVVSEVRASTASQAEGTVDSHSAEVIGTGGSVSTLHDRPLKPGGLPGDNLPTWAREEFDRRAFRAAGLMAIVHSKLVVVDPFSSRCAVITGSHNFSVSASARNDENLVVVRGNQALARACALHIEGVRDHFAWRAFLSAGGQPDAIYQPLDGWRPGGRRSRELAFWMR